MLAGGHVRMGELPVLLWIGQSLLEPRLLLVPADVQVKLQDQHSVFPEHPFEINNLQVALPADFG
ncbi:hypothetical protein D3C83_281520 [compost metagenome]